MIRDGRADDAAQMAEIFNYYVENSNVIFSERVLTAEAMLDKIAGVIEEDFPFAVTEEDGRLTGYCYAHRFMPDPVYGRTLEITIYLRHGMTGHGIGTALLSHIVERCRQAGAHTLLSFVTGGNTACERLHLSLGFERAGTLRQSGYKMGQYWDDVIYQLML